MRIILFLFILFFSFDIIAQLPTWAWAKSATGNKNNIAYSVATDLNGNVYITGSFTSPTITFGSTTLTNAGTSDIFVVKYNSSGTVIWAKTASCSGNFNFFASPTSITTDLNGNTYVTGGFAGTSNIIFGNITLTNTNGTGNVFIVKYDQNGNVIWAKGIDGPHNEAGFGVTVSNKGSVYLIGYFQSLSITVGNITLTNDTTNNSSDMFVAKYDVNGNTLWAKKVGGSRDEYGYGVSTDMNGNLFVAGSYQSSSIALGSTTLSNSGYQDVFIAKYDSNGNVLWANRANGANDDIAYWLSCDVNGNALITGAFNSPTMNFGTTSLINNGNSNGSNDIFIAKYSNAGSLVWAKNAGGSNYDASYGIATDASGCAYITGSFQSDTIVFGSSVIFNDSVPYTDIFVSKYDANGNAIWAKSVGGTYNDNGYGVAGGTNSSLYVTGSFGSRSIAFATTTLNNADCYFDPFLAKLNGITGIAEKNNDNGVMVYPNPNSGVFMLKTDKNEKISLQIFNLMGKEEIPSFISSSGEITIIDANNLSEGIYYLRMSNAAGPTNSKLVIAR